MEKLSDPVNEANCGLNPGWCDTINDTNTDKPRYTGERLV